MIIVLFKFFQHKIKKLQRKESDKVIPGIPDQSVGTPNIHFNNYRAA